MSTQFSDLEKACIRLLAEWFSQNRTEAKSKDVMERLGIDRDKYEPMMRTLKGHGIVRVHTNPYDGYAADLHIDSVAVQWARLLDADQQEENAPKDIVEQVTISLRRHPITGWVIIFVLALTFVTTLANQLLGVFEKVGLLNAKP